MPISVGQAQNVGKGYFGARFRDILPLFSQKYRKCQDERFSLTKLYRLIYKDESNRANKAKIWKSLSSL